MEYLINKTGGELYYKTKKGLKSILENELLTASELLKICTKNNIYFPFARNWFDIIDISSRNTFFSFGVRFKKD